MVPVLNKIDLPCRRAPSGCREIEDIVGIDAVDAVRCSAKTGLGVDWCWKRSSPDPAPGGSGRAAAGADHRLLVRLLPRRRVAGADQNGSMLKNDQDQVMSTGQVWGNGSYRASSPRNRLTDGRVVAR